MLHSEELKTTTHELDIKALQLELDNWPDVSVHADHLNRHQSSMNETILPDPDKYQDIFYNTLVIPRKSNNTSIELKEVVHEIVHKTDSFLHENIGMEIDFLRNTTY